MDLSNLTSWKDITLKVKTGFIATLLVAVYVIWAGSDRFVVTQAEAAEDHKKIARWQRNSVRRQIEATELKKVETKYRPDLQPKAKDELISGYDIKLKRLRKSEACLDAGRLDCE